MKEIVDYVVIVRTPKNDQIDKVVKNYIASGWQPLGGVSICVHKKAFSGGGIFHCAQAMVKYKQEETKG